MRIGKIKSFLHSNKQNNKEKKYKTTTRIDSLNANDIRHGHSHCIVIINVTEDTKLNCFILFRSFSFACISVFIEQPISVIK